MWNQFKRSDEDAQTLMAKDILHLLYIFGPWFIFWVDLYLYIF